MRSPSAASSGAFTYSSPGRTIATPLVVAYSASVRGPPPKRSCHASSAAGSTQIPSARSRNFSSSWVLNDAISETVVAARRRGPTDWSVSPWPLDRDEASAQLRAAGRVQRLHPRDLPEQTRRIEPARPVAHGVVQGCLEAVVVRARDVGAVVDDDPRHRLAGAASHDPRLGRVDAKALLAGDPG